MDEWGFIITGHDLVHDQPASNHEPLAIETSLPGVFAAGDVGHGSTKQVASIVGEGTAATIAIRDYLQRALYTSILSCY